MEYAVSVYSIELEDLASTARKAKPVRWEAIIGTIAEQWLKEGEARGIEPGIAQGEARTRTAILARLRENRFGPLPARVRKPIDGAPQKRLDAWLDNVLDAQDL